LLSHQQLKTQPILQLWRTFAKQVNICVHDMAVCKYSSKVCDILQCPLFLSFR
jgi:3-deoxy-D-manno-octulosonic acid (KDO) 8-phosphate synthase